MRKIIILFIVSFFFTNLSAQCWESVSAGGAHTIAIRTGGTLWSWGRNNFGQLGTGGVPVSSTIPIQIGTSTNWKAVSSGNSHTIAIKTDGTLWAWGTNVEGQLGNGSVVSSNVPMQIGMETNWKTISSGDEYVVAIKQDGTLWSWGQNDLGQLGDNTIINKTIPTQIGTATDWLKISAGTKHTLAIKTDGTLWAWGSNNVGQLGDNTTVDKRFPIQIGLETLWQNAMASISHSVANKSDGSLWTWGDNTNGQLGDGTVIGKIIPINIVSIANSSIIAKGHQHCLVKKIDGTLWSWGGNASGQLGDGTSIAKTSPVQVSGLATDWLTVNSKKTHTVALKNDGTLYSWGANLYGQLGDGSNVAKNIPTIVNCPTLSADQNVFIEKLIVYPNPASNVLNVQIPTNLVAFEKVSIVDVFGKIIIEEKGGVSQINIENLTSGIYLVQVYSLEGRYQSKFIKN